MRWAVLPDVDIAYRHMYDRENILLAYEMQNRPALQFRDIKMGFARVSDLYRETGAAVDIVGERGYVLARIIPEIGYEGDARAPLPISGKKFRSHRYRVAYSCYWGMTWRIEQRGGNFVIFPPEEYRSNISPAALNIRLSGVLPRATPDNEPKPPLKDVYSAISRITRSLLALEGRVYCLEADNDR